MGEDAGQLDSPPGMRWLTFAEIADESCPIYMAMGMPYHEYWHGNYAQLSYYRKAYERSRERANYDAWLQGAYVYDALCMVSPLLHAFAKQGTKASPYHESPYSMQTAQAEKHHDIAEQTGAAKFHAFAAQFNKKFQK